MTITTTATVQTLAAEVRVLQVGSRQVTMSVFKQLDFKPLDAVDIFGRVSVPAKPDDNEGVHLVGRLRDGGDLVRVWVPKFKGWYRYGTDEFYHWLLHAGRLGKSRNWTAAVDGDDKLIWRNDSFECTCPRFMVDEPRYRHGPDSDYYLWSWFRAEHNHRRDSGEFFDFTEAEDLWKAAAAKQLTVVKKESDDYSAAQSQPLIVLAGLR